MLRESKHLQIIAVVIGLTSIGAGLVDQQLNMAAAGVQGARSDRCDDSGSRTGAGLRVRHRVPDSDVPDHAESSGCSAWGSP